MAKDEAQETPKGKEFGLKPIESNILAGMRQQMDGITSLILSYIAVDRLAYEVKQTTQFTISPDFKTLTITEVEPPADTPQVEAAGDNNTAQAIKGGK